MRTSAADMASAPSKGRDSNDKAERLISVARDIVRETGNFDLPMRTLAARAQVSLRSPYEIFGSKNGVVRAILAADHALFLEQVKGLRSTDLLSNLFDRIQLGLT